MKSILVAAVFFASVVAAHAQTSASPASGSSTPQASTPVKNPIMTSVRTIMPGRQKNIPAAIEAMPADKFSYKPTPDQMTFAHLVVHIVESNYGMCAKLADITPPKVDELKETDPKDKLLAATRASFDFCSSSLANLDDSKMADDVEIFGRLHGPRALVALFLASSWADHYGAAAMYLRLNGILPPTAQPKK
jgi:DinB superfamily